MIHCRCRRHPCNLFREGSKDFVKVWYHVKGNRCFVGKINGHPKIIMTVSTCDIELFIRRIVPIGKLSENVGYDNWIFVPHKKVVNMRADCHLFSIDVFICNALIVRVYFISQ